MVEWFGCCAERRGCGACRRVFFGMDIDIGVQGMVDRGMNVVRGVGEGRRDGFSLVEMLLVIGVIGLMIALLLPALAGARQSAMKVSTQSMMADLTSAAQRFGNDNSGRNPGYFSEALMGHSNNLDVGMSAMENAMLDLGGSAAVLARADDENAPDVNPEEGIIEIGPSEEMEDRVIVNINLIGSTGAYYTPDAKSFVAAAHGDDGQAGRPGGEALSDGIESLSVGQVLMPDLVDAWGNPMLAWSQDQSARGSILVSPGAAGDGVYRQFVRVNSDGSGGEDSDAGPAWFYLVSNAAFLEATEFGGGGVNMAGDPNGGSTSVIGGGVNDIDRIRTLATVLASPSSFLLDPSVDGLGDAEFTQVFPSTPRGRFMVQSAGSDGIFLSNTSDGWASSGNTLGGFSLDFGNNYISQNDARITDDNDAFTNIDLFESFDDLLTGTK